MNRYAFVSRRVLSLVPLLLGILAVLMLLLDLTPGDPARLVAGPRASAEGVAAVAHDLGLDQPWLSRYLHYVGQAVTGDLGTSFKSGRPVLSVIGDQLPVTLTLATAGILLALMVCLPLALLAARRPNGLADHVVRAICVLGVGLPSFWVAVLAIRYVALPTGWFPVAGYGVGLAGHARAMVLPAIVVAASMAPPMIRSLRAALIELTGAEFVLAGRTLGYRGRDLVRAFQLRNAVSPLVSVTAAQAGYALFGTVVVEVAFGLPGMGLGLALAASTRDYPLVQGYTLVFAVLVVLLYLFSDVVQAMVDPRTRITA
ncbi:ABC transporter permease [Nonomuraea sp. NPDC049269]|uniref:ABC transporter permease n=1 Tax=Nonomuraea sp. NPDC049269 TaxID=3364349 RepID=UPI003717BE3E